MTRIHLLVIMLVAAAGCAGGTFHVRLPAEVPLNDRSAVQPDLGRRQFSKIIVLPSSGTARAQFEEQVNAFEREFLRSGVTVISGAITGRVVLDSERAERKSENAATLSDVERALVMAKETGAQAILQIGNFEMVGRVPARYLVLAEEGGKQHAMEVSLATYQGWTGRKTALESEAVRFRGKLIDVSNGEVAASFDLACAANWNMPSEFTGEAWVSMHGWTWHRTNFPLEGPRSFDPARGWRAAPADWERAARQRCVDRIVERLIAVTLNKQTGEPQESSSSLLEL